MNRNRSALLLLSLSVTLALAACGKKDEAPVAPTPAPAPAPAPAPVPAPAPTASVVSVDLGNAVGADMRVTAPATSFAAKDTIFAAVGTSTSDPAATVNGKLSAKWTYQDGQTVHEDTRDIAFNGPGVTDFQIAKPDGWPKGKYKVEISLNGAVVQSKDFEVH